MIIPYLDPSGGFRVERFATYEVLRQIRSFLVMMTSMKSPEALCNPAKQVYKPWYKPEPTWFPSLLIKVM